MEEVKSVFVQVIEKPARKVIIKRGKEAKDYLFMASTKIYEIRHF